MSESKDKRFDKLFKDPKYRDLPKNVRKVELSDSRFSHMLTDPKFSSQNYVDEYGKKQKKEKYNKDLEQFYTTNKIVLEGKNKTLGGKADSSAKFNKKSHKKDEEDDEKDNDANLDEESEEIEKSNDEENEEEEVVDANADKDENDPSFEFDEDEFRGEEDSSDTSEQFDEFLNDYIDEEKRETDAWDEYKDKDVPVGDASKRLAVMNLNWDCINSSDLFVLFSSLSPKPNMIKSVYIYPSDFGIKEKANENMHGPDRDVFTSNTSKDNKEKKLTVHSLDDLAKKETLAEYEGCDPNRLRAYELKKLKYYYAVVEFKSLKVSNFIYETYDGMEIERTQMFMELRFVPDSLEFPHKPRDLCTAYPENYEQKIRVNRALDHSKVKLTWDQDDEKRGDLLKKAFANQFKDEEIQDLLVSSSEDDDEDAKNLGNLLFKQKDEDEKAGRDAISILKNKRKPKTKGLQLKDGEDFEIVFKSGFEGIDKDINKEKTEEIAKGKTGYQEYIERKKVIGKEKRMELRIKQDEVKKRKYQDQMFNDPKANSRNLKLVSFDANSKDKKNAIPVGEDSRFSSVKTDKNFWVDPTSTEFRKKIKRQGE